MTSAVTLAGSLLERDPVKDSFLEALLEQALGKAIIELAPGSVAEQTGRGLTTIPGWDRKLGNFDLQVRLPGEERPSILIETKVDDVGDQLWDTFKLTSVPQIPGAVAGYLVAAAECSAWEKGGDCFELYAAEPRVRTWGSGQLFVNWEKAWTRLLGGGSARPHWVPRHVETTFIVSSDVAVFPNHEIRCVRVRPRGTFRVSFVDGQPQIGEEGDIPDPEAEERLSGENRPGDDAAQIFYDDNLSTKEKEDRLQRLADAGDTQAQGYLGSIERIRAAER